MMTSRALHRTEPVEQAVLSDAPAPKATSHAFFRQPIAPILTVVALTLMVVVAISFARAHGLVAALWGASGLAAAVWLRGGRGAAYDLGFGALVAFGVLAGEFLVGNPPGLSLLFTGLNLLEIGLAVALTRRFVPSMRADSVAGLMRLLAVSAVAVLPSAVISGLALESFTGADALQGGRIWWFGHALGMTILLCLGLSLTRRELQRLRSPAVIAEGFLLAGALAGACYVIFSNLSLPYGFLLMPLLVASAVRFRVVGSAAALCLTATMAIAGTMTGYGPYAAFTPDQRAVLSQLLVLLGYMPVLIVAAVLEERDAMAERARLGRERAERASAAKSRLLANVAHEIKSPVGGIIGIGELWAGGHLGAAPPNQVEMAQMMVKTARQIETLAHDLLDVARAESGAVRIEPRPTDVAGVFEDARRALALHPEATGLRLEISLDEEGLVVLADSQRLAQIIGNLTGNAVKYGRSGGFVRLSAVRSAVDRVRLTVTDGGPGLSEEKQAQLFEPFNRLGLERSSIEGHGIGLALAKRLIELQDGEIGVVSAPGKGASFWIDLPAA